MLYKVIGLMSGSSLDGLDIAYAHLEEITGKWTYEICFSACYPYSDEWVKLLKAAPDLSAREYQSLHYAYGHFTGQQVIRFMEEYQLQYQVQLIASHGHTVFHDPVSRMTSQLGDGAAIAARTGIHVISDLRSMDIALGGQGAPIVPIGEKLLLPQYELFLNLGGIANISQHAHTGERDFIGFDICPANRVLNMLAAQAGFPFDKDGDLARQGHIQETLLSTLNGLDYYSQSYPKSLANQFGTDIVFPILHQSGCSIPDLLRTYTAHICDQIYAAVKTLPISLDSVGGRRLLLTGGGAHNNFLVQQIAEKLRKPSIETILPDKRLIDFKEALIMSFIGVLRWRQENNVLASVTGASRDSIGGTIWVGQEG